PSGLPRTRQTSRAVPQRLRHGDAAPADGHAHRGRVRLLGHRPLWCSATQTTRAGTSGVAGGGTHGTAAPPLGAELIRARLRTIFIFPRPTVDDLLPPCENGCLRYARPSPKCRRSPAGPRKTGRQTLPILYRLWENRRSPRLTTNIIFFLSSR